MRWCHKRSLVAHVLSQSALDNAALVVTFMLMARTPLTRTDRGLARSTAIRDRPFPSAPMARLAASSQMAAGDEGLPVQLGGDEAAKVGRSKLQHPIMRSIDGGANAKPVEQWEAQFEADLAVMLRRYLADHPAPGPSQLARDADHWASNLEHLGQERLAAAGVRRLRSA